MTISPAESFTLPLTLRNWPWQRRMNPYYKVAQAQSGAWLESFRPFRPEKMAAFNKCDFALVSALTFPDASLYNLRSCCDLMNTFFALDEYTDVLPPEQVRQLCDLTADAIQNPERSRPKNEHIIGEITRQFWIRARAEIPAVVQERFVRAWKTYLDSVVEQAVRRATSYVCTLDEYMIARRDNIGSDPSFAFLEVSLGLNLPHFVMEHPTIVALNRDTTDMIILANDMCSYRKEVLANDADYNAVTVVMHNYGTNLSGAMEWISDLHDEIVEHFLLLSHQVIRHEGFPSFGPEIDDQLARYIDGLGQWIRGHDEWNFASGRYFGSKGLEIQQSRLVSLY